MTAADEPPVRTAVLTRGLESGQDYRWSGNPGRGRELAVALLPDEAGAVLTLVYERCGVAAAVLARLPLAEVTDHVGRVIYATLCVHGSADVVEEFARRLVRSQDLPPAWRAYVWDAAFSARHGEPPPEPPPPADGPATLLVTHATDDRAWGKDRLLVLREWCDREAMHRRYADHGGRLPESACEFMAVRMPVPPVTPPSPEPEPHPPPPQTPGTAGQSAGDGVAAPAADTEHPSAPAETSPAAAPPPPPAPPPETDPTAVAARRPRTWPATAASLLTLAAVAAAAYRIDRRLDQLESRIETAEAAARAAAAAGLETSAESRRETTKDVAELRTAVERLRQAFGEFRVTDFADVSRRIGVVRQILEQAPPPPRDPLGRP